MLYPKKKGSESIGVIKHNRIDTKRQKLKLCNTPLCFVAHCKGLKYHLFPRNECILSISGSKVAIKTTITKAALYVMLGRKNNIPANPNAKWLLINMLSKESSNY